MVVARHVSNIIRFLQKKRCFWPTVIGIFKLLRAVIYTLHTVNCFYLPKFNCSH